MKAKVLAAALCTLCAAATAPALSLDMDINAGLIFIGSTGTVAAPSPLLPCVGVSFPMTFGGNLYLEPGIDFWGLYYEWNGARAVPTGVESGAGFYTVAALASVMGGIKLPLSDALELGAAIGLDALFRVPVELANTSSASVEGRALAFPYFYGRARFLYPETRVYLKWKVRETNSLLFFARAMYPVFHLWDGETLPFLDQLMVSAGIGFTIALR